MQPAPGISCSHHKRFKSQHLLKTSLHSETFIRSLAFPGDSKERPPILSDIICLDDLLCREIVEIGKEDIKPLTSMAISTCRILDTGDIFPQMSFSSVGGETIILPRDFGERWNVLFFYRGHW